MQYSKDWVAYGEWAGLITKVAYEAFLQGSKLGVVLGEPHLVSNAAVYLWNYNRHLIESEDLAGLIPVYRALLTSVRKMTNLKSVNHSLYGGRVLSTSHTSLSPLVPAFVLALHSSCTHSVCVCYSDEVMVVRVCALLARGIAKKWKPSPVQSTPITSAGGRKSAKGKGGCGRSEPPGVSVYALLMFPAQPQARRRLWEMWLQWTLMLFQSSKKLWR